MRTVLVCLALGSGPAVAEPVRPSPFTVTAGLGVAMSDFPSDDYRSEGKDRSFTSGPALRVDVGYHVHPNLAIGVHTGLARVDGMDLEIRSMFSLDWPYTYTALEAGVTVQVKVDRFWLAPWVGMQQLDASDGLYGEWQQDLTLGYGLAAGGTVYRTGMHRVDLYASATRSVKPDPEYGSIEPYSEAFLSFAAGVAYRY